MEKKKTLTSITISNLTKELANGNESILNNFWSKIEKSGTPLIEPIKGDESHKLVTFIIRGNNDTKNAVVVCSLVNQDDVISNNICERIENTDIFYKSFVVLNGTRIVYTISIDNSLKFPRFYDNLMNNWDTFIPDPYNSKRFTQRYRRDGESFLVEYSVLELPGVESLKWSEKQNGVIPGKLKELDFKSNILNAKRKMWIYTPNNYDSKNIPLHLLIILDGKAFIEFTKAPLILDNLQAEKKIPPTIAIFIHNYSGSSRGKDLLCQPQFTEFIIKDLIPWVHENYNVSSNPAHSILMGSSSGGLAASYIGFKHPEMFRNILSQSGFYQWYPGNPWFQYSLQFYGDDYVRWWSKEDEKEEEWLTKQYLQNDKLDLKFYLNVGNLETRAIKPIQNFHKMLQKKGYTHFYKEFPGGHEYIAWQTYLPEGLIYLIGSQ